MTKGQYAEVSALTFSIAMFTYAAAAVAYGYHGTETDGPAAWNADFVISHPEELLEHL